MTFLVVETTVASREDARQMAQSLVERGLAACVHIAEVESFYNWSGKVQNETEFRVLFKTRAAAYEAVERAIRELHTYELPDIHAYAIERISATYAAWIEGACQGT